MRNFYFSGLLISSENISHWGTAQFLTKVDQHHSSFPGLAQTVSGLDKMSTLLWDSKISMHFNTVKF